MKTNELILSIRSGALDSPLAELYGREKRTSLKRGLADRGQHTLNIEGDLARLHKRAVTDRNDAVGEN